MIPNDVSEYQVFADDVNDVLPRVWSTESTVQIPTAKLSWFERQVNDRKVAGLMPVLGITLLCPWKKILKTNFPTGTLYSVEDWHRCLFHNRIYRKRKIKKKNK